MNGAVDGRLEAIIHLRLKGPDGDETEVDATIDTGFTESLTLLASMVVALGLIRQSGGQARLADGSLRPFDLYSVEVFWDGRWRPLLASTIGDETLVGMRLLAGFELRVPVVPGGTVQITPLPRPPGDELRP